VLADPDFYARDRTAFAAAGAELAKAQDDLTAAEEDWLRLELLREDRGWGARRVERSHMACAAQRPLSG
jgi:hypothetical protein